MNPIEFQLTSFNHQKRLIKPQKKYNKTPTMSPKSDIFHNKVHKHLLIKKILNKFVA